MLEQANGIGEAVGLRQHVAQPCAQRRLCGVRRAVVLRVHADDDARLVHRLIGWAKEASAADGREAQPAAGVVADHLGVLAPYVGLWDLQDMDVVCVGVVHHDAHARRGRGHEVDPWGALGAQPGEQFVEVVGGVLLALGLVGEHVERVRVELRGLAQDGRAGASPGPPVEGVGQSPLRGGQQRALDPGAVGVDDGACFGRVVVGHINP